MTTESREDRVVRTLVDNAFSRGQHERHMSREELTEYLRGAYQLGSADAVHVVTLLQAARHAAHLPRHHKFTEHQIQKLD